LQHSDGADGCTDHAEQQSATQQQQAIAGTQVDAVPGTVSHVPGGSQGGQGIAAQRVGQELDRYRHHDQVQQQGRDRNDQHVAQAEAHGSGKTDAGCRPEQGDIGRGAQVQHREHRPGEIQAGQQCPP